MRVPYLEAPPLVVPIDGGWELVVDDFLIAENGLPCVSHRPVKPRGNPVFYPQTDRYTASLQNRDV